MPKQVFWPLAIVIVGLIFLASNLGLLPREFFNLWPLMFIIVGLGGLLTADRTEWMSFPKSAKSTTTKKSKKKK